MALPSRWSCWPPLARRRRLGPATSARWDVLLAEELTSEGRVVHPPGRAIQKQLKCSFYYLLDCSPFGGDWSIHYLVQFGL